MSKSEEFVNWWEWDNVKVEYVDEIRAERDALKKRVEELKKQRNERTHLLNAEVARNQRYKKVLEKIVNHAGTNKEIDYELWKMAKRVLEGESECSYGN